MKVLKKRNLKQLLVHKCAKNGKQAELYSLVEMSQPQKSSAFNEMKADGGSIAAMPAADMRSKNPI